MNRRAALFLIAAAAAQPQSLRAQPARLIPRVGFLGAGSAAGYRLHLDGFRRGLRESGYTEGKNLIVEYCWAEGEQQRLPALAAALVERKVDAIVTHGTPGTRAAQQATQTIPIVMASGGDAVYFGLVNALNRPGGNVTGISHLGPELAAKRLQFLKDGVPHVAELAFLTNPDNPISEHYWKAMEPVAQSRGVMLQEFRVRHAVELEDAFESIASSKMHGVLVDGDGAVLVESYRKIALLALRHRLPAISMWPFAEMGGLMSYSANFADLFRTAGMRVGSILRGVKPKDLPVEQPLRIELTINRTTAKALGVDPERFLYPIARSIDG